MTGPEPYGGGLPEYDIDEVSVLPTSTSNRRETTRENPFVRPTDSPLGIRRRKPPAHQAGALTACSDDAKDDGPTIELRRTPPPAKPSRSA